MPRHHPSNCLSIKDMQPGPSMSQPSLEWVRPVGPQVLWGWQERTHFWNSSPPLTGAHSRPQHRSGRTVQLSIHSIAFKPFPRISIRFQSSSAAQITMWPVVVSYNCLFINAVLGFPFFFFPPQFKTHRKAIAHLLGEEHSICLTWNRRLLSLDLHKSALLSSRA